MRLKRRRAPSLSIQERSSSTTCWETVRRCATESASARRASSGMALLTLRGSANGRIGARRLAMIVREQKRGRIIPAHMEGGLMNPLGARALYLFNEKGDTGYRLHGSPEWWSIGKAVSAGCIRLMNQDIIDLYDRATIGTKVIVI
ncbi:L,D-transpeptidase [Mesorhizobium sp. M1088]|uniref:L,D-transpeptidase n=1 Tax=Mesorhizobium sp. M1088 TaxID=2957056 RepID=UPI00333B6996